MAAAMLMLAVLFVSACGEDPTPTPTPTPVPAAASGDRVAVHYHGTLDDGTVFDSSLERTPLEFVVGSGQVIPGFDDAVTGLRVDESRTVRIPPAEAYGELDAIPPIEVDRDQLPEALAVGDRLETGDGRLATVVSLEEATATLLVHHRLAGEALTFEITLVEIK